MSIVCRISDEPYQVIYDGADVQQIANAEKKIPTAWINEAGNDVTEEMVRYLRPLIHGSVAVPEQDSMPHCFWEKRFKTFLVREDFGVDSRYMINQLQGVFGCHQGKVIPV